MKTITLPCVLLTFNGSIAETYLQLKLLASNYQIAKKKLMGDGGPFIGWLVSGSQWQEFNRNGETPDGIQSSNSI